MSAIAGVVYWDGRLAEPRALREMVAAMAHRGPDGQDVWCDGPVGLGHGLLLTAPEPGAAALPLVRDGVALVADARIDNREELLAALALPADVPDAEVLFAGYRKWGRALPERLVGDFAIAIWDAREHELFLARDPFGVRPLYLYEGPGLFAFGTEIKALFRIPEVPRTLDDEEVARHLLGTAWDLERTVYESVRQLPPAHALRARDGRAERWRYWELDPERQFHAADEGEYYEGFREHFTRAVRSRLRSATPVGISLSGGMDSSAVAAVARTLQGAGERPLHTFSGIFPSFEGEDLRAIDERAYIDDVLALGGFTPHFIRGDELGPLEGFGEVLRVHDQPLPPYSLYLIKRIMQTAEAEGVRVMLDGAEGDIVASHGFTYFTELAFAGEWDRFARLADTFSRRFYEAGYIFPAERFFGDYGVLALAEPLSKGKLLAFAKQYTRASRALKSPHRRMAKQVVKTALPQRFRRWVGAPSSKTEALAGFLRPHLLPSLPHPLEAADFRTHRATHVEDLTYGAPRSVETVDACAAAHGVEPRHPFYDRRLVEYCVALPAEILFADAWSRAVLRFGLGGTLPERVRWRVTKSSLGINVRRNMREMERERLRSLLVEDVEPIRPYLDVEAVAKGYKTFDEGGDAMLDMVLMELGAFAMWRAQTEGESR